MYHTEEEKAEAKRRHRMAWYDRNRKKVLKDYKIRKCEQTSPSTSRNGKLLDGNCVAQSMTDTTPSTHQVAVGAQKGDKIYVKQPDSAPQILLGRVHRQDRMLRDLMQSDAEQFCSRVANEVILTAKGSQINLIQSYMDKVTTLIDGARPHTVTLFNQYGAISEWREAKQVQNNMGLVIQYLDEIYHQAELGELDGALALGLLVFQ